MSKLFDSLTGYFFPESHGRSSSSPGGASAVASPPEPGDSSIDASADSTDEPPSGWRAYARPSTWRSRLRARRPIHRDSHDHAQKPWGDDVLASPRIHPLAVIDPRAELAADVAVGPFCVIGPNVTIGPGCRLHNHVTVVGHTTIGSDNEIFPNVVLGTPPQDRKFGGEETRLVIGDSNVLREAVTIHVGTVHGGGLTRIGDNNFFMVNVHMGHDVSVGSDCVFANNVMIAGHCQIGDRVSMMGAAGVHHFVTIGSYVFVGGAARVHHDVPPYVKIDGADAIRGINVVGLRRGGMSDIDIAALEVAARRLFYARKSPMSVVMGELLAKPDLNPRVREVIDFLRRRNLGLKGRYLESLRER